MFKNLYDVFDLPDFFDDEKEFDKRYSILGSRWHPRRNINMYNYAEKRFKELSKAYSILADNEKRKNYNQLLSIAPNEDQFKEVLQPFNEDKGLDFYDAHFKDFLGKRNKVFNDEFFKESDKEFKELEKHNHENYLKSVNTNTIIRNGKRISKKTKTSIDKDGNKTIETEEDHGDGHVKFIVAKIFHDTDGNLIKEITEDTGEGPKLKEKRVLALNDKAHHHQEDSKAKDESTKDSTTNKMILEDQK